MVWLGLFVSLAVSALWGPAALTWGPRLGYVDVPDDPALKTHRDPAVPLGGVGVFAGFHAGTLVAGTFRPEVLAASTLLLVLGLVDDRLGLRPLPRLGAEAVAGILLGWSLGGDWTTSLAVAFLVVVAVNAVNLFDGLDTLAAGTGMVTALGVAALASARGSDPAVGLILAAGLLGFLRWNWPPAKLFLGDNGAYVVGGLLVAAIAGTSSNLTGLLTGACLLGVFLIDLTVTVVRRLFRHQPLFGGDRSHLYDQMSAKGMSVLAVAASAAAVQAVIAVVVYVAD